ncbi:MAG: GNAT family N-acetyltransferase [Niveispirillum sp.]|uniref:GNAT family N-acetyltransferase n=1 Tax=Niveispirillum sp. TaxID=1917217 RepID=UPI003BA6D749
MRPLHLPPAPASFAARGISLRAALPADAEFMRDVYVAGRWEEMAAAGWPDTVLLAFLRDQYRLQTLHYDAHYADAARLVVECDGVCAGKLLLLDMETEIRIVDIGLMPAFRGRGTGAMLVCWTQDIARALGCGKVSLHVEPNNPARRLYLRLGFQVAGINGAYERMDWVAPQEG